VHVGESFVGDGPSAAHVNTLVGHRDGPVGAAFATALATPSAGHAPFLAVVQPGVPAKPPTLFVNKAAIAGEQHARLTWGPAQAGVAAGVADAVADGTLAPDDLEGLVVIAAVWVNPDAEERHTDLVYANNRAATVEALRAGRAGLPDVRTVLEAARRPHNPFFDPHD
jgi:5,6,7,8-tetrahydromethanopterin hydro-lyase